MLANELLYIPQKVAAAVSVIIEKPLTLITAGAGYGKTTAVIECLSRAPKERTAHWYTCYGEPPERAWEGICRLIAFADERVGEYLSKFELPTLNHLGQIATLMGQISCEKETILVIDNFQLAAFPAPFPLLSALAAHVCGKLHLVVLTQPLGPEVEGVRSEPRITDIPQAVFRFSPADIQKLFSLGGAALTEAQAARLYSATEGWVAAIRLHLSGFLADGTLRETVDMDELMEHAFWRRLNEREQSLFLGLSLLDTFTEVQAAHMLGRDVMPDELWTAVRSNAFVRSSGKEYTLHSLLRSFLGAKLQIRPASFCKKLYGRAGAACQAQGKNVEAVLLFIDAEDDMSALSVPLNSLQLYELVRAQTEPLQSLLSRCHAELLSGRCQLLLSIAAQANLNGRRALARTAILRLKQLQGSGDDALATRAAAALEVAASFSAYNDIAQMRRHHLAAIALLGEDAQDFDVTNNSWTFIMPSVVYMFWRESGKLADTAAQLRESIPNYALLAGGKGLGGPEMMAAEMALLRGELEERVTQGYLARAVAQSAGQDSIAFCAYTLFARAAILRGDVEAFVTSVREIERLAFGGKEFLCVTAAETALGVLYSVLDREDKIPGWLLSAETIRETLYPVSVPFAFIILLRYIRQFAPEELIGTAEGYMLETEAQHHLLPKLYYLLEEAAWYQQRREQEKALKKVALALSLALPDGVVLPFAEYYAELAEVYSDSRLAGTDVNSLARIHSLGRRFASGVSRIRAGLTGTSPLTAREREIALLAQRRVSTKEIAVALCISPATVKNTLNRVYSKLNIVGKAELADVQF